MRSSTREFSGSRGFRMMSNVGRVVAAERHTHRRKKDLIGVILASRSNRHDTAMIPYSASGFTSPGSQTPGLRESCQIANPASSFPVELAIAIVVDSRECIVSCVPEEPDETLPKSCKPEVMRCSTLGVVHEPAGVPRDPCPPPFQSRAVGVKCHARASSNSCSSASRSGTAIGVTGRARLRSSVSRLRSRAISA